MATIKAALDRPGVTVDAAAFVAGLSVLGIDVRRVVMEAGRMVERMAAAEFRDWLEGLQDGEAAWAEAAAVWEIDPSCMAHAASHVTSAGVLAYSPHEDRPGPEWDLLLSRWGEWIYLARSTDWQPVEAAKMAAKWLVRNGLDHDMIDDEVVEHLAHELRERE